MRPHPVALLMLTAMLVPCAGEATVPRVAGASMWLIEHEIRLVRDTVRVPCTNDSLANGEALRQAVEQAVDHTFLSLGPCLYRVAALPRDGYNSGIRIRGKKDLVVQGAGLGVTTVRFARAVYVGFEISSQTEDLTIRDMTIAGSITQSLCTENPDLNNAEDRCFGLPSSERPNTHGIASHDGQDGIADITLSNLEVRDLAVGISVGSGGGLGGCRPGAYMGATVSGNYVHDIHGSYGASGYGIGSGCAEGAVIRKNVIVRVGRHSIYQGMTANPNPTPVLFVGNTIVDHGHGGEIKSVLQAAVALARSDNIIAIDNRLIGGHAYGIAAEYDPATQRDCTRCVLIGNKFLNVGVGKGASYDIAISAHSDVWTWFNTRDHRARPNVFDPGKKERDATRRGEFWAGTQAVSAMFDPNEGQDYLYVMRNNILHRVAPDYGNDPQSGWRHLRSSTTNWPDFFGMTADHGKVYVWQNGILHAVNPQWANAEWPHSSSPGWSRPHAMASPGDGQLYVIQRAVLHRVNPSDWSYVLSSGAWESPRALAVGRDLVYLKAGDTVYGVAPGSDRDAWPRVVLDGGRESEPRPPDR